MDELLTQVMESGLDVNMGPHSGIPGFYATVYSPTSPDRCPECENAVPLCWIDSGHGLTLKAALQNAIAVHNGEIPSLPRANFANLPSMDAVEGMRR